MYIQISGRRDVYLYLLIYLHKAAFIHEALWVVRVSTGDEFDSFADKRPAESA